MVLRHHLSEYDQSTMVSMPKALQKASGKPITLHNNISKHELDTLNNWLESFKLLKKYPIAKRAFDKYVDLVAFIVPSDGEDAAWATNSKTMFLATRQAGYNAKHMLRGLVHEIGHAVEDNINIDHMLWDSPPFANDYCWVTGEDFAECFMLYNIDPGFLQHTTPLKFGDMEQVEKAI